MNYIYQLNNFYKKVSTDTISANAHALYNYLLNKNSELGWIEEFTLSNTLITAILKMTNSELQKARKQLVEKNYINYTKGTKNQSGKYSINELVGTKWEQVGTNSEQIWNKYGTYETLELQGIEYGQKIGLAQIRHKYGTNSEQIGNKCVHIK